MIARSKSSLLDFINQLDTFLDAIYWCWVHIQEDSSTNAFIFAEDKGKYIKKIETAKAEINKMETLINQIHKEVAKEEPGHIKYLQIMKQWVHDV